jgi:uncharacterized protein YfiM (DUF2279 family)
MHELLQAALVWSAMACSPGAACTESATPPVDAAPTAHAPRADARIAAATQRQDPWLGHDKFTHAGASWAATTFTFGAARAAGLSTDDALLVAVPTSLALGVVKELMDRRSSFFSVRDLVADAIGTAAAYFFLREVR